MPVNTAVLILQNPCVICVHFILSWLQRDLIENLYCFDGDWLHVIV